MRLDPRLMVQYLLGRLARLERKRFPCWGIVTAVDLDGTAEDNVFHITPGYRVLIYYGGGHETVWCERLRSAPSGDGWGDWWELEVGDRVLVEQAALLS